MKWGPESEKVRALNKIIKAARRDEPILKNVKGRLKPPDKAIKHRVVMTAVQAMEMIVQDRDGTVSVEEREGWLEITTTSDKR